MDTAILTNRIELELDHERINSGFDIYVIKTDLISKANYGQVINKIYKEVKPLSLTFLARGTYALLVRKDTGVTFVDSRYTITQASSKELQIVACARLLVNAMPHLSDEQSRHSEGAGLYYLSDIERIAGITTLRAFEIKLNQTGIDTLINIDGVTFTPIHHHTNSKGEIYSDCSHLPRFKFDKWSQELLRAGSGDYIKKKHRERKMTSEMVSLDTKNPGKFWKTKMGVLALFLQDVERIWGSTLKIKLLPLSADYRVRFKEIDVNQAYAKIDSIIRNFTLNVVNLTDTDVSVLIDTLVTEKIPHEQSSTVKLNKLNFVIHHPAEYYEAKGAEDPYNALHIDPTSIVQSIYPGTLFKDGNISRPAYEACKKEFLIKIEVNQNKLLLITPPGCWTFIRCVEDETATRVLYHILKLENGNLSYSELDENDAEIIIVSLPGVLSKNGYAVINDMDGDGFIFEDTGMVAIPDFRALSEIMRDLAKGFDQGLPRAWVIEFLELLSTNRIEMSNTALVKEKLTNILNASIGKDRITKKILLSDKETKISYRGSFQTFFDWITVEKGLRFGASLKSREAGLIEASLGLFYNEEERLYFVGEKDNIKTIPKFCRIRRVISNTEKVPQELLKMMEVFHIRHKQATTYPFLFKHISEYAALNQFRS